MEKPPGLPALLPARPGTVPHRRAMTMGLLTVLAPMLTPVLVLTGWSAVVERSAAEARLQDAADALTRMVEGDLATVADSLAMAVRLGSLPNDPERFRAPAQRLRDARPGWRSVFLATPYAQVMIDSEGVPAAQPPYAATVRTAIVEGRAAVSGRLGEPALLAVALPLMRDGMVEAVVGATLAADRWSAAPLPEGWRGILLDQEGRTLVGTAPTWLAGPSLEPGIARGPDAQGEDLTVAVRRSARNGWTVVVAAPTEPLRAPLRRRLWMMGGLTLGCLAFAGFALHRLVRRTHLRGS
jgi:hypothetical protein